MTELHPINAAVPDEPPAELRFRNHLHPVASMAELWRRRELVRTLAERDLRARYKQALLSFAWAIVNPLVLMIVFTVFFRRVARVDTGDIPYPVFSYLGLLPWTFFSTSLSIGGMSLINNTSLLNKVYCPREVFPLAAIVVAAVDMVVATGVLVVLFVITGYAPRGPMYWVPLLLLLQFMWTSGVVLIFSSLVVYLRDLRHALAIILQLGLFATPIAYDMSAIPSNLRPIYSFVNPLAPIIDAYRRTVLRGLPPEWGLLGLGALSSVLLLFGGFVVFKKLETGIADVA